jgi:hypothetical protein
MVGSNELKCVAADPYRTFINSTETQRAVLLKPTNWKTVAEFVGITAIVGSLIFVGLQLRQEQAIAIVDTYGSVVESNEGVLTLIGSHPDIWEKGLLGEELSTSDEIVFSGMVRAVMGHHMHMVIRFSRLGPLDPQIIPSQLAYAIYIFPGLRRQWEADSEFRDHRSVALNRPIDYLSLRRMVEPHLRKLDELKPGIPTEKQFIFWYF